MVTSVALGLVISFEPHEIDVMFRPPRETRRPILDGFGLWRVVFVGLGLLTLTLAAFFGMKSQGADDALARTAAVNAITVGQIFFLLNSRFKFESSLSLAAHKGNKYLPMGIGAVVVLQLLFTYAPPLQAIFDTAPLPLWLWPLLLLARRCSSLSWRRRRRSFGRDGRCQWRRHRHDLVDSRQEVRPPRDLSPIANGNKLMIRRAGFRTILACFSCNSLRAR